LKFSCKHSLNKLFFVTFISVFIFMPLFPNLLGSMQLHISIGSFVAALAYLFISRSIDLSISKYLLIVYVIFLLLLLPSFAKDAIIGEISISNLTGLVRPIFLCTIALMFTKTLADIKDMEHVLYNLFKFIVFFTFLFSIFELFISASEAIIETLYKRDFLKKSVAVTFYGQSYFSAFANFTILVIVHARYLARKKFSSGMLLACAVLTVIFSQSKAMWFCLIAYAVIYTFITSNKVSKFLLISLVLFSVVIFIDNLDTVVFYLQSLGLSSTNSLSTVLDNPEESGTLTVRVTQILFALDAIAENYYLWGAGTGTSLYLESIYASFLYRYGGMGLALFFFSVFALCFINIKSYSRMKNRDSLAHLALCLAIWSILLPISQISSPMIEISKPAILSVLMFSLSLVIWKYSKRFDRLASAKYCSVVSSY